MDEVFKISSDRERAKDLLIMSKERLDIIKIIPEEKTYKIIEEYYEIIKELLTAIMYVDGYKTLSHVALIEYFSANYKDLENNDIKLIDDMRKYRNSIVYYGKKISHEFLVNDML
ncbi:hypothetical protein HYZ41_00815 [archaeon]|nr:hypothetical protein [archaeon]